MMIRDRWWATSVMWVMRESRLGSSAEENRRNHQSMDDFVRLSTRQWQRPGGNPRLLITAAYAPEWLRLCPYQSGCISRIEGQPNRPNRYLNTFHFDISVPKELHSLLPAHAHTWSGRTFRYNNNITENNNEMSNRDRRGRNKNLGFAEHSIQKGKETISHGGVDLMDPNGKCRLCDPSISTKWRWLI